MMGGVIAIVFTLSIFALQHAAELYSSEFFETYTRDWKDTLIYFLVVAIALSFFGSGLFLAAISTWVIALPNFLLPTAAYSFLLLLGLSFVLIDWHYKNVREKINPLQTLTFLETQSLNSLRRIHRRAERIAKVFAIWSVNTKEESLVPQAYVSFLTPSLSRLDRQLESLCNISLRLAERGEVVASRRGFTAIHNVLEKYLEFRKDTSLALPSPAHLLAYESDSQSFLAGSFEKLSHSAEQLIRKHDSMLATHIVDIYSSLGTPAADIQFIGANDRRNPILDQLIGYLSHLLEFAMREEDLEVVFRGSQRTKELVGVAATKGLNTSVLGIQNDLAKIGAWGITAKRLFVTDNCVDGFLKVIKVFLTQTSPMSRVNNTEALSNLRDFAQLLLEAKRSEFLPNALSTSTSLTKPYADMNMLLQRSYQEHLSAADQEGRLSWQRSFLEFVEELCRSLRVLSERIKDCDSILVQSITDLIFGVTSILIMTRQEATDPKIVEKAENQLRWYVFLPYWFIDNATSCNAEGLRNLGEAVSKTGIVLLRSDGPDSLVTDCVNSLNSVAKQSLEKLVSRYGYDEPRVMLKLCYLGILALKHDKVQVFRIVRTQVREFDKLYWQKYSKYLKDVPKDIDLSRVMGPKPDQLFQEIFKWRLELSREQYNQMGLTEDAQDMMLDLIGEEDIDRFMAEVWDRFPADSTIRTELEEKSDKVAAVTRLVSILRFLHSHQE